MINQFIDEVLSNGAEAVLPQHLSSEWIDRLYVGAKEFIAMIGRDDIGDEALELFQDDYSMALLMAVLEIVQHQAGYPVQQMDIPEDEMMEKIKCYAMSIVLECISRISDIKIDPPTVDDIFNRDRIIEFEKNHPEITDILHRI